MLRLASLVTLLLGVHEAWGSVRRRQPQDWSNFCPRGNPELDSWLRRQPADTWLPAPGCTLFDDFVFDLKKAVDKRRFHDSARDHLFSSDGSLHPSCNGAWLVNAYEHACRTCFSLLRSPELLSSKYAQELGVYSGKSINQAAQWKVDNCPPTCPWVWGFDVFSGLPERWERYRGSTFEAGRFNLKGRLPKVLPTVRLVKGLFNESLPQHLLHLRSVGGDMPVAYLHVDCDLYAGARDALLLLNDHMQPGTIILFDELVNYQRYREGELRALWEWLQLSAVKVAVYGMRGLQGKDYAMELDLDEEILYGHQAVAFVVMAPGRPIPAQAMPAHLRSSDSTTPD